MKRLSVLLLVMILFITGCEIVNYDSVKSIVDTVLYEESRLTNTNFEGYSIYLPQGTKVVDKNDYNLKIKDSNNYYYLYVDTIAYYYKTKSEFDINKSHFFTTELNNGNLFGYVDISEYNDYYFVVIMYNYAKIESFIPKDDFNAVFANMCSILSSVKFNDKVIDTYIDNDKIISQAEEFNIFSSKNESDNFLKYEQEYDVYDNEDEDNNIMNDEDHIDLNVN